MLPKDMADWCQSVEVRFTKILSHLNRVEGENIIILAILAAIAIKVWS